MKKLRFAKRVLVIMAVLFTFLIGGAVVSSAAITQNATGFINSADGATLRSSFSTSAKALDAIPNGTKVSVLSETFTSQKSISSKSRWYKVSYSGKTGYVRADLVNKITYNNVSGIITGNINIRKGPGTRYKKAGKLESCKYYLIGLSANYKGKGTWYKIKYGNYYRYISGKYVIARGTGSYDYGIGKVKVSKATVRKSYSADSEAITKLAKNQKFIILSQVYTSKTSTTTKYRWYKVRIGKSIGYIKATSATAKFVRKKYHTTKQTSIRKGPSADYKKIATIKKNQDINIYIKTECPGGKTWYKVYYKGYYRNIDSSCVAKGPAESQTENVSSEKLEKIYKEELAKFPADYQTKLKALHKEHPTWIFKAKYLDFTWSQAVNKQFAVPSANLYSGGVEAKKAVMEDTYDFARHSYIGYDGPYWVCASKNTVKYYMDPRNWLTSDEIFMFESFKYDSGIHKEDAVKNILATTGVPVSNSKYYMSAAEKYGISPIYLASKTRMELGTGSGKGTSGGTTVYNVFNIGAFDDGASGGAQNGYNYAKSQGWTTYKKAITDGAKFIVSGYMNNNQYSLYYERFNVLNGLGNVGMHQYCTNIFNAATMANVNYWSYRDMKLIESDFVFEIPVYKSMPSSPCAEPLNGNNNNFLDGITVKAGDKTFVIKNKEEVKYGIVNDRDGVNLRKSASESGTRIGTLTYKECVTINGSTKDDKGSKWYKVSSDLGSGYVKASYIKTTYFDRFTQKYYVEVPYDVKALNVNCTTNVSDTKVTVSGSSDFAVGKNTIKIAVKSSSGLYRYYYIYVTRLKAQKSVSSVTVKKSENETDGEADIDLIDDNNDALSESDIEIEDGSREESDTEDTADIDEEENPSEDNPEDNPAEENADDEQKTGENTTVNEDDIGGNEDSLTEFEDTSNIQ